MPFEHKPGQGALFKNRDQEKNPKSPNLKGSALMQLEDGSLVELEIAGWTKESEKAGRWLSLCVKLKSTQPIRQSNDADLDRVLPHAPNGREHLNQRLQEMGTPIDEPAQDDDRPF